MEKWQDDFTAIFCSDAFSISHIFTEFSITPILYTIVTIGYQYYKKIWIMLQLRYIQKKKNGNKNNKKHLQ